MSRRSRLPRYGAPLASVSFAVIELDVGVGDCTGGMLCPLAAAQTRVFVCRLGPNVRPWRSPAYPGLKR